MSKNEPIQTGEYFERFQLVSKKQIECCSVKRLSLTSFNSLNLTVTTPNVLRESVEYRKTIKPNANTPRSDIL